MDKQMLCHAENGHLSCEEWLTKWRKSDRQGDNAGMDSVKIAGRDMN